MEEEEEEEEERWQCGREGGYGRYKCNVRRGGSAEGKTVGTWPGWQ
jgi:hypothetical protein